MRPRLIIVALAALLGVAALALPAFRWLLWRWESNPVLRGRLVAEQSGCFACHLGISGREIPNPGSRWGSVPRFAAGNAMMYAEGPEELEEFVRYGAPRSWTSDPKARERLATQHLRMPGYEGLLPERKIQDLLAFVLAVENATSAQDELGASAKAGRELALRHGCLACHGVEGSGGLPNPGSLGGFIPGFQGKNFDDLVQTRSEFREWVLEGESSRLGANALLRYFWSRQQISMPAYREELSDQEVESLWLWVSHLRNP